MDKNSVVIPIEENYVIAVFEVQSSSLLSLYPSSDSSAVNRLRNPKTNDHLN